MGVPISYLDAQCAPNRQIKSTGFDIKSLCLFGLSIFWYRIAEGLALSFAQGQRSVLLLLILIYQHQELGSLLQKSALAQKYATEGHAEREQ